MDGFVGLNVNAAYNQISDFYYSARNIYHDFDYAITDFFSDLDQKWASPVAEATTKGWAAEFGNIVTELDVLIFHTARGALSAGNTLARSHGTTFPSLDLTAPANGPIWYPNCRRDIDGVTGMAVQNVRITRDALDNKMKQLLTKLNELPKCISFYSTDGSLLTQYQTGVSAIASKISELVTRVISQLTEKMDTEIDNILLAQSNAKDQMAA